ncbi:SET domain-containing protein [Piedraia hortae CBS 480.64]|uniref:SET domain-containing protein n=1 Tax=Piedraia hortae CBS 480.64 TaxID=1314780 RepID=A0A6A7BZ18_9PEZI|nr:SET domain-containing protein [Piedraia hortae CBS 480.64]
MGELVTEVENRGRYKGFEGGVVIDATERSGEARFVNRSREPNCEAVKVVVDESPHIGIFAGERGVKSGEEVTIDYRLDCNSEKCYRGIPSCRRGLGRKRSASVPEEKKVPKTRGRKRKAKEDVVTTKTPPEEKEAGKRLLNAIDGGVGLDGVGVKVKKADQMSERDKRWAKRARQMKDAGTR